MKNEIYNALIGAQLTHQEHAAATAIIRASAAQSVEQVAAATRAEVYHVRRTLRALVGRKVLTAEQSGGARRYSLNEQVFEWK